MAGVSDMDDLDSSEMVKDDRFADFVAKPASVHEKNLFGRFVDRIKTTLFQTSKKDLKGRVQELEKNADQVLRKLHTIKEELRSQIDGDVFTYVETLMEPMARDVKRIQKLMNDQASLADPAKAYKKYNDWIERAKLWVELEAKVDDQVAVIKTIIQHTFTDSDCMIDQDLQVISDYESHILSDLPVSEEEKKSLQKSLQEKISSDLESLAHLKEKPTNLELRKVTQWKSDVDRNRSHYFNSALREIDAFVQNIFPVQDSGEQHEHLVEIFLQIAKLEEEVPRLLFEIHHSDLEDAMQKKRLQMRLVPFQFEIHQLNLDLRLTPELFERLQDVQSKVQSIENLLL